MTNKRFQNLCMAAFREFVKLVPNPVTRAEGKSTGNLANNATKIRFPSPDVCEIYVDESIAPYLPYTNEPWVAERWHGKQNPNEQWIQNAVMTILRYMEKQTKGELSDDSNSRTGTAH